MRSLSLLVLIVLCGCVLHSKTPLFSDAEAVPVFGRVPVRFAVFDAQDGAWVASDEPVATLTPAGRHYEMADPSAADPAKVDSYFFVRLDGKRLVVQVVTGGEADYAIATWDGKDLLASPLDCARLKTSLKTNDLVGFTGDNCALLPSDTPALTQFGKLALRAGPPTLRFERQ